MNLDSLRAFCLSLPHTAEKVQWEDHLLFTIGGKMFVITSFEPGPFVATLKPDPEHRLELLETEGVEPAPYLARAGWVAVRTWDTLRDAEWRDLVAESYRMVLSKLPKRMQAKFAGEAVAAKAVAKNTKAAASKHVRQVPGKKKGAAKSASRSR